MAFASVALGFIRQISLARAFQVLTLTSLLVASYWSVRFAVADFLYNTNNPESLRQSLALAPENASYTALLAEHIEGDGLNPDAWLTRAAELSPLESRYWIRLGFRAEAEGNYGKAEQYLLHAAAIDRKFDPRWALMSFYFRRENTVEFWRWLERAFQYNYRDPAPMFQLAWIVSQNPEEIRKHLPADKGVLSAYLSFLLQSQRLDASIPIAREVAALALPDGDAGPLLAWWDQVSVNNPTAALDVWNTLCQRKALPFKPLDPLQGSIVTNGDFSFAPLRRAYDWRTADVDGVSVLADQNSRELTIAFNGKEPEDILLAEEWIPLAPGLHYAISWEDSSPSANSVSGLCWVVTAASVPEAELARYVDWSTGDWTTAPAWQKRRFVFAAGPNRLAHLRLFYKRPLGFRRAEGSVMIRKVASEKLSSEIAK